MKLKKLLFAFMTLTLVFVTCVSSADENMLQNPNIESLTGSGYPEGWGQGMWYRDDGTTVMSVADGADGNCLLIENLNENDARFTQSVSVKPNTMYRISCKLRAQGCDPAQAGAGISVENTFISSRQYFDTNGEWVTAELYGITGDDQTSVTVMARIGGYGSLNIGSAWFDDFEMTQVTVAPEGAIVNSLATIAPVAQADVSDADDEYIVGNAQALWSVAVALVYIGLCALGFFIRSRDRIRIEYKDQSVLRFVLGALAVAMAVRIVIALCVRGYKWDMNCFEVWAVQMAKTGPSGFYTSDMFCDYPPGYMYVLWLVGGVSNLLSLPYDGRIMWLLTKIAPILCDTALAYIIYKTAKSCMDNDVGAIIAVMFAFNPVFIIDSAAWGQIDSVLIALLLISMLLASKGKWLASLPIYALAVLVKPQALIFAPLGLAMLIVEIVASDRKLRMTLRILAGLAISVAVVLAVMYPFTMRMTEETLPKELVFKAFGYDITFKLYGFSRHIGWLINQYAKPMSSYNYITVNACNLYCLLDMNWVGLEQTPSLTVFSWVMMVLSIAYSMFLYVKAKDRGKIFITAAMMMSLMFAFAPKMHERYLMPALAFLVIAFVYDRDVRLVIAFLAMTLTMTVNTALVLQNEHLIDPQRLTNSVISLINVLNAVFLAWTGWAMCFEGKIISITKKYRKTTPKTLEAKIAQTAIQESLMKPKDCRLNLKRKDFFIMISLTLVYAVIAFTNLGDTKAPQTQWKSTAPGEELTFDLGESKQFKMMYFGGICDSTFLVQFSDDGVTWTPAHYAMYDAGQIYVWKVYQPYERDEEGQLYALPSSADNKYIARYIRLTCERAGLTLNEVAFLGDDLKPLKVESVYNYGGSVTHLYDPKALVDESDTVPEVPSYLNGMYFDEIYHARTAYEHLHGLQPLEFTHPPLGKVLIMIGIDLFGMTPFGWRFMGALFGVLMIPLMYLMAKQLFKRTSFACIAAFLFLVDGMHFTQTRIATIDVYVVFFIMMMFLFMFRYAMMSFYHVKLYKTFIPLGLCGISMGLAVASKWIGIYGGIGLAVIFFYTIYRRTREYVFAVRNIQRLDMDTRRAAQRVIKLYWKNLAATLLFCIVFFIIIPAAIYYFSYYWHLAPEGGLSVKRVWELQQSMLAYHKSVGATAHRFASPWNEWPLMLEPLWYYSGADSVPSYMVSSISCLGNIVVWWGGFICLIMMFVRFALRARSDKRYLFITVGYLAQYVPWMMVERCTFIYHYFACVPFIILATVAVFECMRKANVKAYRIVSGVYCFAAFAFFAAFYPLMSGLPVLRSYANNLKWFNWYMFY